MSVEEDLQKVLATGNKDLEHPGLFKVASDKNWSDVTMWVPTGCPLLDLMMTSYDKDYKPMGGGWACGRWYEVFGEEGGGKTTLYLQGMVECQKMGGYPAIIDSEARLFKPRLQRMGLDLDRLLLIDAPYMEKGVEGIEKLLTLFQKNKKMQQHPVMIAWDTLSTCQTKAEWEKGKNAGGTMASSRQIHQMIRDLVQELPLGNACLILVDQVRDVIGATKYEKQTDTTGGWGPRYQASVRIEINQMGKYVCPGDKEMLQGVQSRLKIVKSSLFMPYGELEISIDADYGIDPVMTLVGFHAKTGVIKLKAGGNKGTKYTIPGLEGEEDEGKKLPDFLKMIRDEPMVKTYLEMVAVDHKNFFWKKAAGWANKEKEK